MSEASSGASMRAGRPSESGRATMRDVAKAAGVSVSTVSNLLNGRDSRMRPRTKAKLLKVIDELEYRPSRVARQLRTGEGHTLGLVVPSVANPFWGAFARAVEAAAMARGQQVFLCNSERNAERESSYVEELWSSGVRAVVLGSSLPSVQHLRPVLDRGLTLITFDREPQPDDPPQILSVSVDNKAGAWLATKHLLDLGHRRIGYVSGPVKTISRQNRVAGYREALRAAHVRFRRELVWEAPDDTDGDVSSADLGRQGMGELLQLERPPTAVVTTNDMYALGACAAIREAGRAVPDISVVGFDDVFLAGLVSPSLTTIRQPLDVMARLVVDLAHHADGATARIVTPTLVIRESTGPAPAPEES